MFFVPKATFRFSFCIQTLHYLKDNTKRHLIKSRTNGEELSTKYDIQTGSSKSVVGSYWYDGHPAVALNPGTLTAIRNCLVHVEGNSITCVS